MGISRASPAFRSTKHRKRTPWFAVKALCSVVIVSLACVFVIKYVFRYYLHYNQDAFIRGAANYWVLRGWLLLHMTGAMLALLSGPWQFWTGARTRHVQVHRWTGRVFLLGVGLGASGRPITSGRVWKTLRDHHLPRSCCDP